MSVQVGNKKITDQNRNSSTLWQGSMINSTEGSVNANAAKDINVNGSNDICKQRYQYVWRYSEL